MQCSETPENIAGPDLWNTPLLTRREALGGMALCATAPCLLPRTAAAISRENSGLPFEFHPAARTTKTVFAHWHFFPISFDNEEPGVDYYARNFLRPEGENGKFAHCGGLIRERPYPRARIQEKDWQVRDMAADIALASSMGVDAFQYNLSDLVLTSTHWSRLTQMLEASRLSPTNFHVMPCIDCVSVGGEKLERLVVKSFATIMDHDHLYRDQDGRPVISMFMPERIDRATVARVVADLRQHWPGLRFFFMFLAWGFALEREDLIDLADYISIWGGNYRGGLDELDNNSREVKKRGKQWVASIWPQDFRPKSGTFVESRNSDLLRDAWRRVIAHNDDFINLLTWNDYSEGSEIRPSTSIGYSFYDLSAYYIHWLKTGAPPKIIRDALYYFHRINLVGETTLLRQDRPFKPPFGPAATNEIEVVSFLTGSGRIEIETGSETIAYEAPAGLSAYRAPARFGRPKFALIKDGKKVIDAESEFEILATADFQDLLYHGGYSVAAV